MESKESGLFISYKQNQTIQFNFLFSQKIFQRPNPIKFDALCQCFTNISPWFLTTEFLQYHFRYFHSEWKYVNYFCYRVQRMPDMQFIRNKGNIFNMIIFLLHRNSFRDIEIPFPATYYHPSYNWTSRRAIFSCQESWNAFYVTLQYFEIYQSQ